MRHFVFSGKVLAEIERDRFRHSDPLVQRRMEVLWLKAYGEMHARIAELAGLSRATVQRALDQYEAGESSRCGRFTGMFPPAGWPFFSRHWRSIRTADEGTLRLFNERGGR